MSHDHLTLVVNGDQPARGQLPPEAFQAVIKVAEEVLDIVTLDIRAAASAELARIVRGIAGESDWRAQVAKLAGDFRLYFPEVKN